ncbi:hypothetical protein BDW22DRAFT_1362485 [Trametopsis cervina]|nr:hypothetical protein BDW22DRAFT_1362485 [Trametopsis cervina]
MSRPYCPKHRSCSSEPYTSARRWCRSVTTALLTMPVTSTYLPIHPPDHSPKPNHPLLPSCDPHRHLGHRIISFIGTTN